MREYAKALLLDRMEEISEDFWAAGWMGGLEYDLWAIAQEGGGPYGMGVISPECAAELRQLSEDAGGWWVWNKDATDPRLRLFLTPEEWAVDRAEEEARREAEHAEYLRAYPYERTCSKCGRVRRTNDPNDTGDCEGIEKELFCAIVRIRAA
jgi:hypothetical protein